MVRACRIAAHAEPANNVVAIIKCQAATEHDDATHALTDHRISGGAKLRGISGTPLRGRRTSSDDAVKALTGLRERKQIGSRKRHALQAERIGSGRLLHRYRPAAWPLVGDLISAKDDRTNDPAPPSQGCPFVVLKTAICRPAARLDARSKRLT